MSPGRGPSDAVPPSVLPLTRIRLGVFPPGLPRATSIDLDTRIQRCKSYQYPPGGEEKYPRLVSKYDCPSELPALICRVSDRRPSSPVGERPARQCERRGRIWTEGLNRDRTVSSTSRELRELRVRAYPFSPGQWTRLTYLRGGESCPSPSLTSRGSRFAVPSAKCATFAPSVCASCLRSYRP